MFKLQNGCVVHCILTSNFYMYYLHLLRLITSAVCSSEPAPVWHVSRDSGFPACKRTEPQGLEESLLLPATLRPLLLHQGLLQGQQVRSLSQLLITFIKTGTEERLLTWRNETFSVFFFGGRLGASTPAVCG